MVTQTESTAAVPVTLHQGAKSKLSDDNLMTYRISLALMKTLADEGVFTESEYRKICTKLTKNHSLSSSSIFAETT